MENEEKNGDAQCSLPHSCFFCLYPGEPVFSSQQWNIPRTTAPPRGRQGVSGATGEECVCVFARARLVNFRSIVRWPFTVMVSKTWWSQLVSLSFLLYNREVLIHRSSSQPHSLVHEVTKVLGSILAWNSFQSLPSSRKIKISSPSDNFLHLH